MSIQLSPDREAWVPLARRVLEGDYDYATLSTNQSLRIGLRGIEHPDCKKAHERLETLKDQAAKITQRLLRHVT